MDKSGRIPTANIFYAPEKIKGHWTVMIPFLLYLFLSPFYIFPSGGPQISDIVILFGMVAVALPAFMAYKSKIKQVYLYAGIFAAYTIFINLINFLFFPDFRFLLTAMIYPFNVLVFYYISTILKNSDRSLRDGAVWAIAASALAQVIWVFVMPSHHWRGTGSFNNPNQLAYWSLLMSTIVVLLRRDSRLGALELVTILMLAYLQMLALSKSGLITYSIFLFALFFSPMIGNLHRAALLAGAAILMVWSFAVTNGEILGGSKVVLNVVDRIGNIGHESDDTPEARGYYRIVQFPEYALLGAGEGAFARFDAIHVRELHSGIATILFSYGILGASIFSLFLFRVFYRQPYYIILFFIPILMYGLPGQNFRFADFWVFIGVAYAGRSFDRIMKARQPYRSRFAVSDQALLDDRTKQSVV